MDGLELLDELEDIIDKGASVPFSGRCILERDELMDILQELKLKLPDDLKQAKWIKEERQRILHEAQIEADEIIKAAESEAKKEADNRLEAARKNADAIAKGIEKEAELNATQLQRSAQSKLQSAIDAVMDRLTE